MMETKVENVDHGSDPTRVDGQESGSLDEQNEWDEGRIELADKVLKDLYIKVCSLSNYCAYAHH